MDEELNEGARPDERVFVLRFWLAATTRVDGQAQWRIVLQDVDSRRRRGFSRLDEFFAYMEGLWSEIA